MCSTRQFITAAAYWTKEPRAMCLCYSCFWWKHMLIYLFTEKRGTGKGHQLTSQHGRQYGSQFACSSTCYLLKASRRSARSAARPISPHGQRSFLHIALRLQLLAPFCARFRGALQQICFLWGSLLKILDWKLLPKSHGYHTCRKQAEQKHTPQSLNASADLLPHSSGLPSLLLPVVCWGTTALPPPAPSANDCSGSSPWNEVNPWDFFRLQNPNINLSKYQPGFPDDEELSSGSVGPAESLWPLDSLPPQQGHPRADTKGNNQWFRMSSSSDLALRKQMTLLTCPVEAWFWLVLSLIWINF